MTVRSRPRGLATAIKGVVMAGLLVAFLGACGLGGDTQAAAADERFRQIEHVEDASTVVSRPGLPTSTRYDSDIAVEAGLAGAELAEVIDEALLVARDELAPTSSGGVVFVFLTDGMSTDLDGAIPHLGDVGKQFSLDQGSLVFSQAELKAYVSPSEGA